MMRMASSTRLHKIMEQVGRLDDADLRVLDAHLHTLIADREREALEPIPTREGRAIVEQRRQGRWTLRLEFVTCGKGSCHCAEDQGHGPYWYAYRKQRGKIISRYVGKHTGGFGP
jgi:hypothetical protein